MLFTSRCAFETAVGKISIQRSIHTTGHKAQQGVRKQNCSVGHSQSRAAEGWEHCPRKITSIYASFC